ncbi:MAG: hypothetical protein WC343_12780 [Bacilli bacterium]|jgi:hypothetical protein
MSKEIVKTTIREVMDFNLYREGDSFTHNNEVYSFVTSVKTHGDGEWTNIICQRDSDKKFFEYSTGYDCGSYYYEPNLYEVYKKTETKDVTTYE